MSSTPILAALTGCVREILPPRAAWPQVAALSPETPEPEQPARRAVQLAMCRRSKGIVTLGFIFNYLYSKCGSFKFWSKESVPVMLMQIK